MLSYRKINLLDMYILEDKLMCKNVLDPLLIKSPIIIAEKDDNCLNLKINNNSENHDNFMNVCGYINTLCSVKKIDTNLIVNNNIIIKKTNLSKFFDENRNEISFSKLKNTHKVVCSFTCVSGSFLLSECLLIN
jgi:hypothetical protein